MCVTAKRPKIASIPAEHIDSNPFFEDNGKWEIAQKMYSPRYKCNFAHCVWSIWWWCEPNDVRETCEQCINEMWNCELPAHFVHLLFGRAKCRHSGIHMSWMCPFGIRSNVMIMTRMMYHFDYCETAKRKFGKHAIVRFHHTTFAWVGEHQAHVARQTQKYICLTRCHGGVLWAERISILRH